MTNGEVLGRKGNIRLIKVTAFPIAAVINATKIKEPLIKRLTNNVVLDAARTKAGINNADWDIILDGYAGNILRLGLPLAIKRMIHDEKPFYSNKYVIDLADNEPSRGKSVAGYHSLAILHDKPYSNDPNVSRAKKIWSKRQSSRYSYKLDDYDGFTAP